MDFEPEELREGQKLFQTAMVFFKDIVEKNLQDKTIQDKKEELMNALNDVRILGAEDKHIIVTSDPMEEFDDIVMIRFVLYNLVGADVTVILSGGAHTPEERLGNVTSIFEEFKDAEMGKAGESATGQGSSFGIFKHARDVHILCFLILMCAFIVL